MYILFKNELNNSIRILLLVDVKHVKSAVNDLYLYRSFIFLIEKFLSVFFFVFYSTV